jgi:hypothetical protein
LLAEEKALSDGQAFLVALEPPFQEPARYHGRARVPGLAPGADILAQLVDHLVQFGGRGREVVEEC